MALIKNVTSDRILKSAVVLDMGDLGRQAERILGAAHEDAARLVNEAKLEARRLAEGAAAAGHAEGVARGGEEGRTAGRIEGRAQALEESRAQLAQLIENWSAALSTWERERAAMFADAREDVLRFAFSLGQKITHRIAQSDPTIVKDQLTQALALLSKPTILEILINPSDRAVVEQVLPEVLAAASRGEHTAVREDESIAAGGCVVVTVGGRVDATIDTQLARIAEALVPAKATAQMNGIDQSNGDDGRPEPT